MGKTLEKSVRKENGVSLQDKIDVHTSYITMSLKRTPLAANESTAGICAENPFYYLFCTCCSRNSGYSKNKCSKYL